MYVAISSCQAFLTLGLMHYGTQWAIRRLFGSLEIRVQCASRSIFALECRRRFFAHAAA